MAKAGKKEKEKKKKLPEKPATERPAASDDLDLREYVARMERPVRFKIPEFKREDRLKHVIFADQFDRDLLDELSGIADMVRVIAKSREGTVFLLNLLRHKRAMLYFTQPSTRTFLSFMAACQILGITCNEVRDPSVSSETKGESRFDSIRTFSSYFDVIIMRSVFSRLAECCAYQMNDLADHDHRSVPIINAGAGADEHPTQALLDIYTLQRTFQFTSPKDSIVSNRYDEIRRKKEYAGLTRGLSNKVYGFCGDIGRGRTVRSLATLLSVYEDVTMIFIAPEHPKLALRSDLRDRLRDRGVKVIEVSSLFEQLDGRPAISHLDALYMTRIQREHDDADDIASMEKIDFAGYRLTTDLVGQMKEYAPIMHPFPRDQRFGEIPPSIDNDPRAMYFRQARNGMWIRAALLAYMFDVDRHISRYFREQYKEVHNYNEDVV
jgi:aspartate carbamoyltransferase catalytic subunit